MSQPSFMGPWCSAASPMGLKPAVRPSEAYSLKSLKSFSRKAVVEHYSSHCDHRPHIPLGLQLSKYTTLFGLPCLGLGGGAGGSHPTRPVSPPSRYVCGESRACARLFIHSGISFWWAVVMVSQRKFACGDIGAEGRVGSQGPTRLNTHAFIPGFSWYVLGTRHCARQASSVC